MQFHRLDDGGGNLLQLQRRVMTGKLFAATLFIHLDLQTAPSRGSVEKVVTTKPLFFPLL